jgi:2-polyprenyl-3-methyl-5-hydroxy-6-metoxy-1,4-benzoquinol methylase
MNSPSPNPYRARFYRRQAEWHGYAGVEAAEAHHKQRAPYYAWYTRGWLPPSKDAAALDIGCGAGQFLYFLRQQGYTNCIGVDADAEQVALAWQLDLKAHCAEALQFLSQDRARYDLIGLLDVLEHFTLSEAFPLLQAVVDHLTPAGAVILSVPNAESPGGFATRHADITHEIAFTATSLAEMLFCHDLTISDIRDPFPAPVSPLRIVYRRLVQICRLLEALRLRALGLGPPGVWSPVVWARAVRSVPEQQQQP